MSNGSKSVLFAYHTGFNEAYVTKEILKPIELVQNQTGTIDVKFDHNKLFGTASDYTNIYENNIVHNGVEFMIRFMNQLKNSME